MDIEKSAKALSSAILNSIEEKVTNGCFATDRELNTVKEELQQTKVYVLALQDRIDTMESRLNTLEKIHSETDAVVGGQLADLLEFKRAYEWRKSHSFWRFAK